MFLTNWFWFIHSSFISLFYFLNCCHDQHSTCLAFKNIDQLRITLVLLTPVNLKARSYEGIPFLLAVLGLTKNIFIQLLQSITPKKLQSKSTVWPEPDISQPQLVSYSLRLIPRTCHNYCVFFRCVCISKIGHVGHSLTHSLRWI